jgi:hypothetical protein
LAAPANSGGFADSRISYNRQKYSICSISVKWSVRWSITIRESAVFSGIAITERLPGRRYPELINDDTKLLENSFVVPDAALKDVRPVPRRNLPAA